MLSLLSHLYARLGRSTRGRRVVRAVGTGHVARAWLHRSVVVAEASRPDDVTVLIGVRDRTDYRIWNALRSLREQTYPIERTRIVVVDYGSTPANAALTREACGRHDAEYLRVDGVSVWSRARCLNVGLRRLDTKYVMTSDADILLSPSYLEDAVDLLRRWPLSIVCSQMFDLPEESVETVRRAADSEGGLELDAWRGWSSARLAAPFHPSIAVTYGSFHRLIRGYDEYYEVWGSEDYDLMRRLEYLGLRARVLDSRSFYLHQWHPKQEGVEGGGEAPQIAQNKLHFQTQHSIVRNDPNWGRASGPLETLEQGGATEWRPWSRVS